MAPNTPAGQPKWISRGARVEAKRSRLGCRDSLRRSVCASSLEARTHALHERNQPAGFRSRLPCCEREVRSSPRGILAPHSTKSRWVKTARALQTIHWANSRSSYLAILAVLSMLFVARPGAAQAQAATVNGTALSTVQATNLDYVARSVLPRLPGDERQRLDVAARAAWWGLKEATYSLPQPHSFSSCGPSNERKAPLDVCPAGEPWQVGLAAVQVPNFTDLEVERAIELLTPAITADGALREAVLLAGFDPQVGTGAAIVASTGRLRRSWLLRHPAVGMLLVERNVTQECLESSSSCRSNPPVWCFRKRWPETAAFAADCAASLRSVSDLRQILGSAVATIEPAATIDRITLASHQNGYLAAIQGRGFKADSVVRISSRAGEFSLMRVTPKPALIRPTSISVMLPLGNDPDSFRVSVEEPTGAVTEEVRPTCHSAPDVIELEPSVAPSAIVLMQRPLTYEDPGACPFEGCAYGNWRVLKKTPVYLTRDRSSPLLFTLEGGSRANVLTGVVVTRPGVLEVLRPVRIGPVNLEAHGGDTILQLTYRGELCFKVWFRGFLVDCVILNGVCGSGDLCPRRECVAPGRRPSRNALWARVVRDAIHTWWVHVEGPAGSSGWAINDGNFKAIDRFAEVTGGLGDRGVALRPTDKSSVTSSGEGEVFEEEPRLLLGKPLLE